ncbi:MAG: endonuclease/exonuclease/phosphatase family protein [Planctomycetota bacterium]
MQTLPTQTVAIAARAVVARVVTACACAGPLGLASAQPVVDGDAAEWAEIGNGGEVVAADEHFIYAKLDMGRLINPRAAAVRIEIDADADASTGRLSGGLGVDLIIQADGGERGGRWGGPAVLAISEDGRRETQVMGFEADLHFAPTFAGETYEMRIARSIAQDILPEAGMLSEGTALVRIVSRGESTVHRLELPEASGLRLESDADLPAKPEGAVRVMSWNVLWGKPMENPAPFSRVFEAIKPDVVLIQEWDRGDSTEADISGWFTQHASWATETGESDEGSARAWQTRNNDAWGVAVATFHPISGEGGVDVFAPGTRWNFPVRVAAATVETPAGPLVFGTVHYKCCGSLGSEEDMRRTLEAKAVNVELQRLAEETEAIGIVLGGDFNHIGTPKVMDWSVEGLDADGSDLAIAQASVLGDAALYTFGQPGMNNIRPRLDYITYPDAMFEAVNAFVLETSRLSDASLEAMGLRRADSHASDHLPLIVDLLPVE